MGTSITSGRWKLDYEERILFRDKTISATTTDTVLTLYSDLQDLFDQPQNMDDPVPMTAQTPTEFTIGGTDAERPWFMSPPDAKYLSGGAIQTANWLRTEAGENGIMQVPYDNTIDPVASDIGLPVVQDVGADTGVLLGFDVTDGLLWVRPDTSAVGDSFNDSSGNLDVTGGTADVGAQTAAASTGEYLWANPNSVGVFSVQIGTRGFVYQNALKVTNWPLGIGLQTDGEFDILLLVKANDVEVDDAVALFFARRGGALGDWFESDFTNGGRVTIPLTGNPDSVNDGVGHHNFTWTGGSGSALVVGDIVTMDADSTGEEAAVVVNVTDSGATGNFDYFLIRSLTQLSVAAASGESPSTKALTLATKTDLTPFTDSAITFVHANSDIDINNGFGAAPYSITVDPNNVSWERVYQRGKWITRRGSTTQIDEINGESYRGSTLQIEYDTETGTFTEGLVLTGGTSGATGTIVALHDDGANGDMILRNVRGTFTGTEAITDTSTGVGARVSTRTIPTLKFAPLGNMAGTLWQGAPGMVPVLANIAAGREQDYTLTDDNGVVQNPPNTVNVEVTSVAVDDWVSVFRLTAPLASGGLIDRDDYASHATNNAIGDLTFEVQATINNEAPPSGWIRVVYDLTDILEDRYHYASFGAGPDAFTMTTNGDWHGTANVTSAADTDGTLITDSTADFGAQGVLPGMMVRNVTDTGTPYGVVATVGTTTMNLEPWSTETGFEGFGLIGGSGDNTWDSADVIHINELVRTYDGTANVYVPFLDDKATATEVTTTIVQTTGIDVVVRVRQGRVILPFQTGNSIGSTGMSQAAIRTLDTIAN